MLAPRSSSSRGEFAALSTCRLEQRFRMVLERGSQTAESLSIPYLLVVEAWSGSGLGSGSGRRC